MVLEELIAKLGFRATGEAEARKFLANLEKIKKSAREAGKGLKVNFSGSASGLGRVASEFERAARNAKRFRQEAERAARVKMPRGGGGPGGGIGPTGGTGPSGTGGAVAAGLAAARFSKAQMAAGAIASTAGAVIAVKRFANLESAARELGITAEQARDRVATDVETFRKQAPEIGATTQEQVGVAKQFAAAGLDYETAIGSVVPVVKTAKAAFGEMGDVAEAGIASVNNLKIQVGDLGKAFDIMAKGGKEGQVELKDIAKGLPTVASSAQKLGIQGLAGLTDIVAALEIGRKTAPTGDIAANNLYNLFEKIVSDEVGKAFKKKDIDLEKEIKAGQEKGVTAFDTVLGLVKKTTGGDPFRLNELFGDMQARNAINAILQNFDEFQALRKRIGDNAGGTVDRDFKEAMDRTAGDFEKFSAALDRATGRVGEFLAPLARTGMSTITGALEGLEGKTQSQDERDAMVAKLNRFLGTPSGSTPQLSAAEAKARIDAAWGTPKPRFSMPQPGGMVSPSFGSVGDRLNWMKQGGEQTSGVTNNVTNNTNTGNDQRTQTASVTVNATGLEAVGQAVLAKVQSGLSSMGPSVTKGNLTSTGATTSP